MVDFGNMIRNFFDWFIPGLYSDTNFFVKLLCPGSLILILMILFFIASIALLSLASKYSVGGSDMTFYTIVLVGGIVSMAVFYLWALVGHKPTNYERKQDVRNGGKRHGSIIYAKPMDDTIEDTVASTTNIKTE